MPARSGRRSSSTDMISSSSAWRASSSRRQDRHASRHLDTDSDAARTNPRMATRFDQRRASWLEMFGRLRPGATLEQARTEFAAIAARLERAYPDTNANAGVGMEPGWAGMSKCRKSCVVSPICHLSPSGWCWSLPAPTWPGCCWRAPPARQREIATRLALGAGRHSRDPATPDGERDACGRGRRCRIARRQLADALAAQPAARASTCSCRSISTSAWTGACSASCSPSRPRQAWSSVSFLRFRRHVRISWRRSRGRRFRPAGAWPGTARHAGRHGGRARADAAGRRRPLCQDTAERRGDRTGYESGQVLTARIDLARQNYSQDRGRVFQEQLIDRLQAAPGRRSRRVRRHAPAQ